MGKHKIQLLMIILFIEVEKVIQRHLGLCKKVFTACSHGRGGGQSTFTHKQCSIQKRPPSVTIIL